MEKDLQVFPKEQDLLVKEQDVLPKGLRVTNRNHHIGLEGYRCLWTLIENGKKMEQGELALPLVAPGETGTMALPDVKINKQADVRLNVSIVLKEDALWAKAGHEILKEQFALNDHLMAVANGVQPGKRKISFLFWIYGKIVIFRLSVLRRIMIKVSVTGWPRIGRIRDWMLLK